MPIQIMMPALSPTMEEGTLAKWTVKEGDSVSSGDIIAEIETDKATMEFEAVDEGVIGKILVAEGSEGVKVNELIAVLLEEGETVDDIADAPSSSPAVPSKQAEQQVTEQKPETSPSLARDTSDTSTKRVFASPLARRIAADKGLDLSQIKGSGPKGRIIKADVENLTETASTPAVSGIMSEDTTSDSVDSNTVKKMYMDREFEEVALDGMRRTIASRLVEAKQTIPHFYLRREIRLDALLQFRSKLNASLSERGVKLSVNDFIIKACALALQDVPDCNAVWAGDRILKLKPSDVAVAVAVEGGLFTPVIKDADSKSMSAISNEIKDMANRARDRKLAPHEYQGGSFAISNLGMMGIENFDAVINPPHASILAVGAGLKKPIVDEAGKIKVETMLSVTLSADHRVIDGALGAEFLSAIKTHLENPLGMLA